MVSFQPHLASLLKSLPPTPVDEAKLNDLVSDKLEETKNFSTPEIRKAQWEYALKDDIFALAATEGTALKSSAETYYDGLCLRLDLALAFTALDACEHMFPFSLLQDLLETQTIASCLRLFSWIELRSDKLTEGMVPQKGKALVLLRTLNDLLRRLSKMGSTTIFCGRILTFLSGVFPLGERSGVNLRGEYGPTWEGVQFADRSKLDDSGMKIDEASGQEGKDEGVPDDDKMQVDSKKPPVPQTQAEKKEDFYNTFWSMQLPFSKPSIFANKDAFSELKEAVGKVMPIIKEATAKERAMMGSRSGTNGGALKRKREPDEESNSNEYFFAKFLTSPELLDLEVADTHFRRQFLFQLLVLLNHLLNFTKTAKPLWMSNRNRSLQMEFTLEDSEAQWVQETITKVLEELKQTTPNGRTFADTVSAILEREKNWVKWKSELCTPFDKESWSQEVDGKKLNLLESTKSVREKMRERPADWKWSLGTEPLTEIWEMGYTGLRDLQNPFQPGDVKDYVKKIKLEDMKINMKRQRLEKIAQSRAAAMASAKPAPTPSTPVIVISEPAPSKPDSSTSRPEASTNNIPAPKPLSSSSPLHPSLPPKPGTPSKHVAAPLESTKNAAPTPAVAPTLAPAPVPVRVATPAPAPASAPVDEEIAKYEENKQRWAWLALRTARDQYLQHFGKIGTGDIEALAQEIEKQKLKGEDVMGGQTAEEHGSGSPSSSTMHAGETGDIVPKDNEGDVKMEG